MSRRMMASLEPKHVQGQLLGQFRLADPGRADEEEGANWPVAFVKASPVAADSLGYCFNGFILADDLAL